MYYRTILAVAFLSVFIGVHVAEEPPTTTAAPGGIFGWLKSLNKGNNATHGNPFADFIKHLKEQYNITKDNNPGFNFGDIFKIFHPDNSTSGFNPGDFFNNLFHPGNSTSGHSGFNLGDFFNNLFHPGNSSGPPPFKGIIDGFLNHLLHPNSTGNANAPPFDLGAFLKNALSPILNPGNGTSGGLDWLTHLLNFGNLTNALDALNPATTQSPKA